MVAAEDYELEEVEELALCLVMRCPPIEDMLLHLLYWRLILPGNDFESLLYLAVVSSDACNYQVYEADAVVNALDGLLSSGIEFGLVCADRLRLCHFNDTHDYAGTRVERDACP